jgi:CRISPR/Cas system-associated endonuclease/helicase Cas3
MGWFDEDDDDDEEEEEKAPKRPQLMGADDLLNDTGKTADEEEDPLDAYMKSLGSAAPSSDTKNAGRMDFDNEDEATGHWKTTEQPKKVNDSNDDDDDDVDEDGFIKRSAVAKRKLQETFHKAGAKRDANDSNEDEDKPRSKQVDIQLEQVNHNEMKYEPFEKVFWKPPPSNNTDSNNQQHQSWRHQHGITVQPPQYQNQFSPIYDFLELKGEVMEDVLLDHIRQSGYHHPTPVQAQALPVALGGHDALITAPTGSGKTLAYVWPMIVHVCAQHHLQAHETGPIGLILVPTR